MNCEKTQEVHMVSVLVTGSNRGLGLESVRTRMGGEGTSLLPPESVRGMRSLVEKFTLTQSGRFFRYDGLEMPW